MYYRFRSWLAKRNGLAYSAFYRIGGSIPDPTRWAPNSPRGVLLFIVSLAVAWIGFFNYVLADPTPQRLMNLAYQRNVGSLDLYGWIMIGAGLLGIAYSYCQRGHQKTANAILLSGCAFWGGGFIYSVLFYGAELSALGGLGTWWVFAAVLLVGSDLDGAHK